MDTYITLKTFTYPSELAILRGRLESDGIECFVKDELTVQSNPFYSNAIGGVKLQVKESDMNQAIEILLASGYNLDDYSQPSALYTKVADITGDMPVIKKLRVEYRLLIIFVLAFLVCLSIIAGTLFIFMK